MTVRHYLRILLKEQEEFAVHTRQLCLLNEDKKDLILEHCDAVQPAFLFQIDIALRLEKGIRNEVNLCKEALSNLQTIDSELVASQREALIELARTSATLFIAELANLSLTILRRYVEIKLEDIYKRGLADKVASVYA